MSEYKDISDSDKYAHLINTEYLTVNKTRIHGDLLEHTDKNSLYSYTITALPGYTGRYVISSEYLKANSVIKIKKILKCVKNCPSFKIVMEIEIPSFKKKADVPIHLANAFEGDIVVIKNQQGKNIINPKILQKI